MSGHSRWSQIKRRKNITDKRRGQIFSKLAKLISMAAREGTNPETNPKLKTAVEKAKEFNLPGENIERAIKKVGEKDQVRLETILIEAVGPTGPISPVGIGPIGPISLLIEAITDNKNRSLAEIKNILAKNDSKMAASGSLLWQFDQKGVIKLTNPLKEPPERHEHLPEKGQNLIEEEFELELIEAGAEDIINQDNKIIIYTKPEDLYNVKNLIEGRDFEIESVGIDFIPKTPVKIENYQTKEKLAKLFDALDEHDDVEEIYSNAVL